MKVAFVSTGDPSDVRSWSGLDYHIAGGLRGAGLSLDVLGKVHPALPLSVWRRRLQYRYRRRSTYLYERDPAVGRAVAAEVARFVKERPPDVVFSVGAHPIAYLGDGPPVVYWADATFRAMVDVYPDFTNLAARSARDGDAMEAAALERASLAFFASEWAARSAREYYGADPRKVHVVPFGANLEPAPPDDDVEHALQGRSHEICRLLFIGVDWVRKGGEFATEVARGVNERGVRCELTVVGCSPSLPERARDFTVVRGSLDKSSPSDRAELDALLRAAHFLVLPSRAECFGVVLCEANAFAVPALATDVGGIPTVIHDGVNGRTFGLEERADVWADFVARTWADDAAYAALARRARAAFRERLNWRTSARRVAELLSGLAA